MELFYIWRLLRWLARAAGDAQIDEAVARPQKRYSLVVMELLYIWRLLRWLPRAAGEAQIGEAVARPRKALPTCSYGTTLHLAPPQMATKRSWRRADRRRRGSPTESVTHL